MVKYLDDHIAELRIRGTMEICAMRSLKKAALVDIVQKELDLWRAATTELNRTIPNLQLAQTQEGEHLPMITFGQPLSPIMHDASQGDTQSQSFDEEYSQSPQVQSEIVDIRASM